ncbi:MAG: hypothetical protein HOP19_13875, partial [Acidobacteria bacterium]|nr:hypothetical protein [Acidobacteriota bacterium]
AQNGAAGQGLGGGVFIRNGSVTINNATLNNNTAANGGGSVYTRTDGGTVTLALSNTILSNTPSGTDCFVNGAATTTGSGNNLIESNGGGANACPGVLVTTDPALGALMDTAPGNTETHAITNTSPAYNVGNNATCEATDQRGVARPQAVTCDLGAFELQVVINPTITLGASPTVCQGTISASLPYTATTNSPDQYSIDYDATAEGAGFVDVVNATLPISPIILTVPVAASPATYNATLTVRNSSTGGVSSPTAFTVTVNKAPLVTTNPTNQNVNAGANATFMAAASGTPAPTVQWEVSTNGGMSFSPIMSATNLTLTLNTVSYSLNNNQYRAVFSNSCGMATTTAATLTVTCPTITVSSMPSTLPNGAVGMTYAGASFTAVGGTPHSFSLSAGALPSGITLSGNALSGMPSAAGFFAFTITATDANGCIGLRAYVIQVTAPLANCNTVVRPPLPSATPNSLSGLPLNQWGRGNIRPNGTVDATNTQARSGVGSLEFNLDSGTAKADAAYYWANAPGNVVAGRTLGSLTNLQFEFYRDGSSTNPNNQYPALRLSYLTPGGQAGYLIWEYVYNGLPGTPPVNQWVSVNILNDNFWMRAFGSPGLTIDDYNVKLSRWVSGAPAITDGTDTGHILGPDTYIMGIEVGVGSGWSGVFKGFADNVIVQFGTSDVLCANFEPTCALNLNPATLTSATVGQSYMASFVASNGATPYTYALIGALPNNLTFVNGVLSGTPIQSGSFPLNITATDNTGCMATVTPTLTVNCPGITVTAPALPMIISSSVNATFTATGGNGTPTFSATGLPGGLMLSSAGVLSGTPTVAGVFTVTVTATDIYNCTGSTMVTLNTCVPVMTTYVDDAWVGLPFGTMVTFPGDANPNTRQIGVDAFAMVQKAIDCTLPGGTVNVAAGLYTEQVTINKNLTLTGAGKATTTIKAPTVLTLGFNGDVFPIVEINTGATVALSGVTITGPRTTAGCTVNDFIGVYVVQAATLNMSNAAVTDIRYNDIPNQGGCQD